MNTIVTSAVDHGTPTPATGTGTSSTGTQTAATSTSAATTAPPATSTTSSTATAATAPSFEAKLAATMKRIASHATKVETLKNGAKLYFLPNGREVEQAAGKTPYVVAKGTEPAPKAAAPAPTTTPPTTTPAAGSSSGTTTPGK